MFLDSHVHLWKRSDAYWFTQKVGGLNHDFTIEQLQAHQKATNVGAAILVQAGHSIEDSIRCLEIAKSTSSIAGVVGWVDLHAPSMVDDIAMLRRYPKFVGIRPLPPSTFVGSEWIQNVNTLSGLRKVAQIACPVDLLLQSETLPQATRALSDLDTRNLCLNHAARPSPMLGVLEPWASNLHEFAKETRAVVKLSNLAERGGLEWSVQSLKPYVATIIEAFGSERVMFATNWPVLEIAATYKGWIDALLTILDELGISAAEHDDIMWRTASRFYGVPWPPRP